MPHPISKAAPRFLLRLGSQLFARGMNLDWPIRAQNGTWSSRVSNSHGRRTWFTPVRLPYGRILFEFSTTKNGRVIALEVLYEKKFTRLYGNMIFMFRCSPCIVTRELFVKLVRWEQLWEWSELAGLPLRSEGGTPTGNRLKRPRIILKLRTRRNDNLTLR